MPTAGEEQNAPPDMPDGKPFRSEARLRDIDAQLRQARQAPSTDEQIIANKELRRDLDAQLQKLKALPGSRERSLSTTKLQECIMWLGMDLKRLNDTRPYPSSYDPSNTTVEPTADGLKL